MPDSISLPKDFFQLLSTAVGQDEAESLEKVINQNEAVISIRQNPFKKVNPSFGNKIPWCDNGFYLDTRPSFTLDPDFHAGAYYVQEPSSMFLEQFVKTYLQESKSIIALDLCAAPGGKSTHLRSMLNQESLLVSNEVIKSRASILSENIQKWGHCSVVVTQNDPSRFSELEGFFNLIVVDAPCSGEGLFRKDNEAISEWSTHNVNLCAQRQRRIIKDILPALAQDGILIYSTCTFNTLENEENLKWLSQQTDLEFLKIKEARNWGILEIEEDGITGYRFLPSRLKGEGFFISAIRKRKSQTRIKFKSKAGWPSFKNEDKVRPFLKETIIKLKLLDFHGSIKFIPERWSNEIYLLAQKLNCHEIGTTAGTFKHQKFLFDHALALSIALNLDEIGTVELTLDQALKYLKKDTLTLEGVEMGYKLVAYNNLGLGWINQLDHRTNNLYPTHWRIRKD